MSKDLNMNEAPQEDQIMTEHSIAPTENPENPPDLM